jgi:hypothetical protein
MPKTVQRLCRGIVGNLVAAIEYRLMLLPSFSAVLHIRLKSYGAIFLKAWIGWNLDDAV